LTSAFLCLICLKTDLGRCSVRIKENDFPVSRKNKKKFHFDLEAFICPNMKLGHGDYQPSGFDLSDFGFYSRKSAVFNHLEL